MPEMHLKQSGFTYRAWRPFTKNKERIQNFKETKMKLIRHAFSTIWPMSILKI